MTKKIPQDYEISRAHGGSMIVHIKTLLFNGDLYKWNHSNQYDINFIIRFITADEPPDALCTRERQTHTTKVGPINPKYREVQRECKWNGLEPGIWNVSVRVFDANRNEILAEAKTDVTVKWDEVVIVNFIAGNGQSLAENPDDYFMTLKLKDIKYRDEDTSISQLEIINLDWNPNPAQAGEKLSMKANVKNIGSQEIEKLKIVASVYAKHLDDVDDVILNSLSDDKRTQEVYNESLQIGLQPNEEGTIDIAIIVPEKFEVQQSEAEFSTVGTYDLTLKLFEGRKGTIPIAIHLEEDFRIVKTTSQQSEIKTIRRRPRRSKHPQVSKGTF